MYTPTLVSHWWRAAPVGLGSGVIVLNRLAPPVVSQAPAERLPAELHIWAIGGPAPYTGMAGPGRAQ